MLHRMDKLIGLRIVASDGEVGSLHDLYFDNRRWAVRYLVVESGNWLEARKLLISPLAIESIDWDGGAVGVRLTRQQVRGSPDIDTQRPLSRHHEISYFNYYGYPDYMSGPLLWGLTPFPVIPDDASLPLTTQAIADEAAAHQPYESHLCSAADACGWQLQASDRSIGHVEDFILESGSWALRYLIVETSNWWNGRHVVVPVQWISRLDQDDSRVHVEVLSDDIRAAPEYDPAIELSRDYEIQLFGHYRRPGYWF